MTFRLDEQMGFSSLWQRWRVEIRLWIVKRSHNESDGFATNAPFFGKGQYYYTADRTEGNVFLPTL